MAINSVVGYWSLVVRYSISVLKYLLNDQSLMSVRVAAFGIAGLANDQGPMTLLQFFYRHLIIGIDAHFAGNLHCFFGNLTCRKLGMFGQRLGGCLSIRAATSNCSYSGVGLNHVALAAEQERLFFVRHEQQSFQVTEKFVRRPIFCQLDRAPAKIAVVLLQF